jgi:hypothetical protein
MFQDLDDEETDLAGSWISENGRVRGDDTECRIEWLLAERLERLAMDSSGWEGLYRHGRTGRLWELTYPHSEMHGGGPKRLHAISVEAAAMKYHW